MITYKITTIIQMTLFSGLRSGYIPVVPELDWYGRNRRVHRRGQSGRFVIENSDIPEANPT